MLPRVFGEIKRVYSVSQRLTLSSWLSLSLLPALLALVGCGPVYSAKAVNGITYYAPGAGNVDFGDAGLRSGLDSAGYKGEVATYTWTISFNPAIDQTLRINAKLRAALLADEIVAYMKRYPGRQVNLVGLSAGTGIVVWALENMPEQYKVKNVILLGSSLWHRYDLRAALRRVDGKIYNYFSSNDAILAGPMKIFGTIDGVFADDGAGAVGFHGAGVGDRVVNIRWKPEYSRYGYNGGHTDGTSPGFVRAVLSKHIIGDESPAKEPDKNAATRPATTPLAGGQP